jgi:hypothetical protein
MILSCSTITWGDLKDPADFESALATIKKTGYQDVGVEYFQVPPALKKDPTKGAQLIRNHGLSSKAISIDTSPTMGEVIRTFGAKIGWLCLFERDSEIALEKTKRLAEACTRSGVELALHPHVRSSIETMEQVDTLIRACEPNRTSVCFDTAHLTALGINLERFVDRYASKISLVHLKDLREMVPMQEIDYSKDFVDLGQGIADLRGAMKALRRAGYRGAVMVEVDYPQEGTVEESVGKNFKVLWSLL